MNRSAKMSSFTDMLNSELSEYDELLTPTQNTYIPQSLGEGESVEVTSISSKSFSLQKAKDKRQRTKNFTKQEDELLISAWQNISLDPIAGVDQKNGTYWERVHHYFIKHKNFQSDRSPSSLSHRWSMIQLAVNKFQGFYNQADGRSEFSENDKIQTAKDMYKDACKANFSVEHCWKMLRNLPKWNAGFATKKLKPRKESPINSSPECVMLESSEFERPIGRKAAKEMQKKRKRLGNEHDDDSGAAILEQMRADQLQSRKQKTEHLKEMIQLTKKREDREKRREAKEQDEADAKIMAMDTSTMGAIEVEYFNSRKQEIMERRRTYLSR